MYRYEHVTGQIREWIAGGVLKPGDRLLSVREMSTKLGFSAVTVYQAYGILEDEGLLEARSRSGFYVKRLSRQLPEFSDLLEDPSNNEAVHGSDMPMPRYRRHVADGLGSLSISDDLLPDDELFRLMSTNLRWERARREPAGWQGLDTLREAIVKRSAVNLANVRARDIIVTNGLYTSIGVCLDLLAPAGAKILVETPMDAAIVSAVLARNLVPVEIYSHPRFGVDPEQFQYLIDSNDIAACILSPYNHAPTGVSYSLDVARKIAEAATRRRVPIIENLAGQDLLYGAVAQDLSQFDAQNLIIRVGDLSDTLGPRFGLGWISLPRRDHWKVQLPDQPMAGQWARQKAISAFLSSRSYERHLRRLRENLSARALRGLALIFQHFPENCTVSRPASGYLCWVRGPKAFNAVELEHVAQERSASFSPGPLFSVSRAFGNFIALNLSHAWTEERERELINIARLLSCP